MTVKGIAHTALIPLFHNRVQQRRRNDHGAYLWEHAGRAIDYFHFIVMLEMLEKKITK